MKTVWKYQFLVVDDLVVNMPEGAQVLSVQVQGIEPCIWALVDPDAPLVERRLHVRGTGHPFVGNEGRFVGTFQMLRGRFVGHLFEDAE